MVFYSQNVLTEKCLVSHFPRPQASDNIKCEKQALKWTASTFKQRSCYLPSRYHMPAEYPVAQMRRWSIELRPWGDRMDQTLEGVKSFRQAPAPEFDYTVKPGNFMSGAPTHPAEPLQPLPAPTSLPSLPSTLDVGSLPSIDQVGLYIGT